MANRKLKTTAILCVWILAQTLYAQAPAPMTLEEALAMARLNSLNASIVEDSLRYVELTQQELKSGSRPQVMATGGASYAPDSRNFGYDPVITDGGQMNGQIVVEQNIYDGGIRALKMRQLDVDKKRLRADSVRLDRELVWIVTKQFMELLKSDQLMTVLSENIQQISDYFDIVRSMNAGGTVPYTDVLRTQLDLTKAQAELRTARTARGSAAIALTTTMRMAPDPNFSIVGSLDTLLSLQINRLSLIPSDYLESTHEFQSLNQDIARSKLDEDLALHEKRPTIDFTADAGYLSTRSNLRLPPAEMYSGFGASIGVSMQFSLYDGGATAVHVQQAKLATRSLETQRVNLVNEIAGQVSNLRLQIKDQENALEMASQNIETADLTFELTRAMYAGGSANVTDVLNAKQALLDAQTANIDAKANSIDLQIQLEQAITPVSEGRL
ncbi:MAG: TolC family protein [Calditrichaeota bacterium]|nr:TolC family protein [Calditrichota bacterium]MCB9369873.1 TolC family protein [Calditrichota bacterium]